MAVKAYILAACTLQMSSFFKLEIAHYCTNAHKEKITQKTNHQVVLWCQILFDLVFFM